MLGLYHESRLKNWGTSKKSSKEIFQVQEAEEANNQDDISQKDLEIHQKSQRKRTSTSFYGSKDVYVYDLKKTVKVAKKKREYQAADVQLSSPNTIKLCDYVFPISVGPDRQNSLLGNTINLLNYLDHLNDSLSRGINEVILSSGSMTDIKQIL